MTNDGINDNRAMELDALKLLAQVQTARKNVQQVEDTVCALLKLRPISLLLTEDEMRAVEQFLHDFREAYWA